MFAIQRLDHHPQVFFEKREVVIGIACALLRGHVQTCGAQHFVCQALVLTQAHADGAGQIGQRLATANAPSTMAEGKQPGVGVINVHINAAFVGFLNQNLRIRVKPCLRAGAKKQRLVDTVFTFDGKCRQGTKTQFSVEVLGLLVVVQHRQVEITQAAAHKVFDQMPHQHFADTGARTLWVNRQAPQAAAVFRVMECRVVVQAHDAANYRTAVLVFGQPVHRATVMTCGEQVRVDRQHVARLIQGIDRAPVRLAAHSTNAETAKHSGRRAVIGEPQAQGVRRVEKQLLR